MKIEILTHIAPNGYSYIVTVMGDGVFQESHPATPLAVARTRSKIINRYCAEAGAQSVTAQPIPPIPSRR